MTTEKCYKFPASYLQQRFLRLNELNLEDSDVYNLYLCWNIRGELNVTSLELSVANIIKSQESLRTTFIKEEGKYYQIIHPFRGFSLTKIDLQSILEVEMHIKSEIELPFNLEEKVSKFGLIKCKNEYFFYAIFHHVICDGWSFNIFINELENYYNKTFLSNKNMVTISPLQYADYSIWEQKFLTENNKKTEIQTMINKLKETTFTPKKEKSFIGQQKLFTISKNDYSDLMSLLSHNSYTLYMMLLACYALLNYKLGKNKKFVIASAIANRNKPELENIFGLFANIILLNIDFSRVDTFMDLLAEIKKEVLNAFEYQWFPYILINDQLVNNNEVLYEDIPIFALQSANKNGNGINLHNLEIKEFEPTSHKVKYGFVTSFTEYDERLLGIIEYKSNLYSPSFINKFQEDFIKLINQIVLNKNSTIDELIKL